MSDLVRWFVWVGRAEGASLLLLWFVAMPLKYGAGIVEPVAWFGWAHGVFFIMYMVALGSVGRALALSWSSLATGFAASLLPFGTIWYERRFT